MEISDLRRYACSIWVTVAMLAGCSGSQPGTLYGTTSEGGASDRGTVYALTP